MFIAVSNNHGWGRGTTEEQAIKNAVQHSMHRQASVIALWACHEESYVDGMGTAYGVQGDRRRFERKDMKAGKFKEVPDPESKIAQVTNETVDSMLPI